MGADISHNAFMEGLGLPDISINTTYPSPESIIFRGTGVMGAVICKVEINGT